MDRGDDVLFEIAVHHFDLWRHILDTEVEEIFSMIDTRGGIGTTVTVSARLANGALASAVFADASAPRNEIELLGPAGRVRADLYRFDGFETTPTAVNGGEITWRGRQVLNSFAALPKALRSLRLGGENLASYRHSWETFAQAVSDNANYGATVFDGRMATAIADAAGLSAQRNQPVPVSP
jgi:predicted dehydrogenase